MRERFLKLNYDKSEVLLIGSNYNLNLQNTATVTVGSHEIKSSPYVRNFLTRIYL